jgi:hypothetical protein
MTFRRKVTNKNGGDNHLFSSSPSMALPTSSSSTSLSSSSFSLLSILRSLCFYLFSGIFLFAFLLVFMFVIHGVLYSPRLTQTFQLGAANDTSQTIWIRGLPDSSSSSTSSFFPEHKLAVVKYREVSSTTAAVSSFYQISSPIRLLPPHYTGAITLTHLRPSTTYEFEVLLSKKTFSKQEEAEEDKEEGEVEFNRINPTSYLHYPSASSASSLSSSPSSSLSFTTFPEASKAQSLHVPTDFTFVFGSCMQTYMWPFSSMPTVHWIYSSLSSSPSPLLPPSSSSAPLVYPGGFLSLSTFFFFLLSSASYSFSSLSEGRDQPPKFGVFIGDIIYADLPFHQGAEKNYRQLFGHGWFSSLLQRLPNFMMLDDHEFSNDWDKGRRNFHYWNSIRGDDPFLFLLPLLFFLFLFVFCHSSYSSSSSSSSSYLSLDSPSALRKSFISILLFSSHFLLHHIYFLSSAYDNFIGIRNPRGWDRLIEEEMAKGGPEGAIQTERNIRESFADWISAEDVQFPGIEKQYYTFSYGDVGFFVMDTRSFRDSNKHPDETLVEDTFYPFQTQTQIHTQKENENEKQGNERKEDGTQEQGQRQRMEGEKFFRPKSMLGRKQKRILKSWLLNSPYRIKFLVSSVVWSAHDRVGDGWRFFLEERNEIFDFIVDYGVTGKRPSSFPLSFLTFPFLLPSPFLLFSLHSLLLFPFSFLGFFFLPSSLSFSNKQTNKRCCTSLW